jgi:uncharacterized protein (DUF2267 family)
MTATHVSTFERTVDKTNAWLQRLRRIGRFDDDEQAYSALRAVLQSLRDRLTTTEAAHLSAQLPLLVRGVFYEGWSPSDGPADINNQNEFFDAIDAKLSRGTKIDPEDSARAVFTLLEQRVTEGEIEDVQHMLPEAIRNLWP